MKTCPSCGVEALEYKGDGVFECSSCGKHFDLNAPSPAAQDDKTEEAAAEYTAPSAVEQEDAVTGEASAEVSADISDEDDTGEVSDDAPAFDAEGGEWVEEAPDAAADGISDDAPAAASDVAPYVVYDDAPEAAGDGKSTVDETAAAPAESAESDGETVSEGETPAESAEGDAEGAESVCDAHDSESAESVAPATDAVKPAPENPFRVLFSRIKARVSALPAELPSTPYAMVMKFLSPGLMFIYAILIIGFLGGATIKDELFGFTETGYDIISGGELFQPFANAYGANAFVLSMAVILLAATIAHVLVAVFKKDSRPLKYGFYVGEMCVLAMLFVAFCVLIDGGNKEAAAGACPIVGLIFTMIWFAALPFAYVFSVTPDAKSAGEYIKTYFTDIAAFWAAVSAVSRENAKEREEMRRQQAIAAASAAGAYAPAGYPPMMGAYPPMMGAYPPAEPLPQATLCEDGEDDGDVIVSSEFLPPPPMPMAGMAYSPRFDLTLDDVIDSIYVRGRYYGYRITSSVVMLVAGLIITIYAACGIGFFSVMGAVLMGSLTSASLVTLVMALITMNRNICRIPMDVCWMIAYFAYLAGYICACVFAFDYYSPASWVLMVIAIIGGVMAPVLFGLGMGSHYDKKVPLTKSQRTTQLIVCVVTAAVLGVLSFVPAIAEFVGAHSAKDINVGMSYYDVVDILGEPSYTSGNEIVYYEYGTYNDEETTITFSDYYYNWDSYVVEVSYNAEAWSSFGSKYRTDYGEDFLTNTYGDFFDDAMLYVQWYTEYEDGSFVKGLSAVRITDITEVSGSYRIEGTYTGSVGSGTEYYISATKSASEWEKYIPDFDTLYDDEFVPSDSDFFVVQNDPYYPFEVSSGNLGGYLPEMWEITSTNKTDSTSSELTLRVITGCTVSLSYTVSSESGYDYLSITRNGSEIVNASGEREGDRSLTLNSGDTLRIKYHKDSSGSRGSDEANVSLQVLPW